MYTSTPPHLAFEMSLSLGQAIQAIHACSKVDVPRGKAQAMEEEQVVARLHAAFAVIDEVSAASPAEAAGLHVGDEICKFGAVCLQEKLSFGWRLRGSTWFAHVRHVAVMFIIYL